MAASRHLSLTPASVKQVALTDEFWSPREKTNREVTLPHAHRLCKKTGRIDAMKLDWQPGRKNKPHQFWDSDVAKWVEAAACSLATHPDRKLEQQVDRYVSLLAEAQMKDGYLNSYYQSVEPDNRWSNLRDMHELYCAGHLMEAAVAYYEATGKRKMLDVMCRYADCIDRNFGRGRNKKRGVPGHEELELALLKLYRVTGNSRYLRLGKYFIDERGRKPDYFQQEAVKRGESSEIPPWFENHLQMQAHLPVRKQITAEGHAVRALYLYSGMADVAGETGDQTLLSACKRLWKNITQRRMYLTGGIGSSRNGERFTFDYDLPSDLAYAETCASIGLVFFAHRMLHLELDRQYADVMERALYNGVLSGVGLDGMHFFYANPLTVVPEVYEKRPGDGRGDHTTATRQLWFSCSCCPPNIARLLASLGQYIYSSGDREIATHLYISSSGTFEIAGANVDITQRTKYPWKESVRIDVCPEIPTTFTLALRLPGWCRNPAIKVNGRRFSLKGAVRKGYVRIKRRWQKSDRVELHLPMPVERIAAHPGVASACGRVALQRGPLVYCLEEKDNGRDLSDITLPQSSKLRARFDPKTLGGVTVITGKALRRDRKQWKSALYQPVGEKAKTVAIKAVPYCLWNNRGAGEMLVWIGS